MSRLLAVSGDPELARRTLRLYIQVVSKAREASGAQPTPDGELESGVEQDSGQQWVETLVQGSRTLCRLALQEPEYRKALECAREAGTVLEKAKARLDNSNKELLANVQVAEGVWHSVMAFTGNAFTKLTPKEAHELCSCQSKIHVRGHLSWPNP